MKLFNVITDHLLLRLSMDFLKTDNSPYQLIVIGISNYGCIVSNLVVHSNQSKQVFQAKSKDKKFLGSYS
jgi:hypothetical protein